MPIGYYADETPYVEAIRQAARNIDVTYIHNDECDDFAELDRFFLMLEAPVRNPTNLGWVLAIQRLARTQGRRVLLGGLLGNCTISWDGWSQATDHILHGRLLAACRVWRLFYRQSPYSRWTTFRKLFVEPLVPLNVATWVDRHRQPHRMGPWQEYSAIRREFAIAMGVNMRAAALGHDFHCRLRPVERAKGLTPVDYMGEGRAAQKATTGVETRDPTADMDVVCYCFGVPPAQYLVENIDRSLIRRAMWGILPDAVLTNRLSGLQSADWYEKLQKRRSTLASEITALANSPLARRAINLERLESAVDNFPTSRWNTRQIVDEYHLALARGIAAGRFLRWVESGNR